MGINNFYDAFVSAKSSKLVNLKDLGKCRIAIDMSVMMMSAINVHMTLKGPDGLVTNHISTVANNIVKLYSHGILPICVFDPVKHIVTKSEVQKKRGETAKEKNELKVRDYKESQSNYEKEIAMINDLKISDSEKTEFISSLQMKYKALFDSKDLYDKYFKGDVNLFKIAKADVMYILQSLNVPYIIAPDGVEAEQLCALLCKSGVCQYVWTRDMDALVFGAPRIIFPEKKTTKYRIIERKSILEEHGIDEKMLIRMSVALGCDFADKVKGVGPATVFTKIVNVQFDERQLAAVNYFENKNIDEKVKTEIKEKWKLAMDMAVKPIGDISELLKWLKDVKGHNKILPRIEKVFCGK